MSLFRLSTEYLRKQRRANGSLANANLPVVTAPEPVAPDLNTEAVQNALTVLTRYIPTEIVALYIPALSMLSKNGIADPTVLFWSFGIATPLILVLVHQGQRKANGYPLAGVKELPLWRMFASMIAFLVWGLSVPGMPYIHDAKGTVIAGFSALVVSTLLNLLAPLLEK